MPVSSYAKKLKRTAMTSNSASPCRSMNANEPKIEPKLLIHIVMKKLEQEISMNAVLR